MDIVQCRLTEEEIAVALEVVRNETVTFYARGLPFEKAIADAGTEKALRCVLVWLREFEDNHRPIQQVVHDGDIIKTQLVWGLLGHGLDMAAEELETLLKVKL